MQVRNRAASPRYPRTMADETEIAAKVLASIAFLGTFALGALTFWFRRDDRLAVEGKLKEYDGKVRLFVETTLKDHESQLRTATETTIERVKGDVRREVEEHLKTHESHLRIRAELQLRGHDRSWGLLREFMAGVWKAHKELVDFAVAATGRYPNAAAKYDEASAAMIEVRALAAILPPQIGAVKPVLEAFQTAYRAGIRLSVPDDEVLPDRMTRGQVADAAKVAADAAVVAAERIALGWNKALWDSATPEALTASSPPPQAGSGGGPTG